MANTLARPQDSLTNRTFVGLLVAQFFGAFNDQAIHVSAMFFAINTQALSERDAITLMPILFYAPWAIFCTIAGYLADRYSKTYTLIGWKVVEIGITLLAALGFWLGRHGHETLGPWLVLSTVFLMGMQSAFFVPAKYGIMPEILSPQKLSRGNGVLESLSFLAIILGTISGGVMSFLFLEQEILLGGIIVVLSLVGTVASFAIRHVPAAHPQRPFPRWLFGPLLDNIRLISRQRALRVAMVGIAFFTFVVAFMRAAVYMLGESQNPRWDELKTSVVVGSVALGIGLGSPLAGWLSGKRIELRLVIVGAMIMILACAAGAYFIDAIPWLVLSIMMIGVGTGFYIVPLYTLLQHKSPQHSKGDMIATSNFINISGAITASLLFFFVVLLSQKSDLIPVIPDRVELSGTLTEVQVVRGRVVYFELTQADGSQFIGGTREVPRPFTLKRILEHVIQGGQTTIVELSQRVPRDQQPAVTVYRYELAGVTHFEIMPQGEQPTPSYDQRHLPRYLFLGAGLLTVIMLLSILHPLLQLRHDEL